MLVIWPFINTLEDFPPRYSRPKCHLHQRGLMVDIGKLNLGIQTIVHSILLV